ncbi:PQQ-dependent sugar dehydrogenase [Dactylosporangium sp. AC04546]|uniref:PQQ-dependent sugar dehydrogenase n=1 Tax=Dactylosporangium sp. AC04546 TaxID=2862460 RepID=UPI001EE126CD|nr:PQQ-dependent sugar dehydrogenase [Dactylosporangium sp. AC04546]WVK84938.1 PQQ-dependent sugar dehydrogenase [Dactylosporangium sp. AC04546]
MRRRTVRAFLATALMASIFVPIAGGQPAAAGTLPAGFQEQTVFSGLTNPTNIEFSPDGRVFVAEKRGTIKVFDSLSDPTPDTFADLRTNVHDQWDRGLLGMALAPGFPTNPWVYVLYTYDAVPGGTAPRWNDVCADANNGTCVVTGRLSRLQANGNQMTGSEQVLITDWCQQFPSHSIGDLHFGADGALYASSGDGASFNATDYGQFAGNPCGDPPGGTMSPPTAEGGALRSQDVRTTGDATQLNGTIIRIDPNTGAAMPNNPFAASADANARRIVAYGMRNPFRFTMRPGTNEVWSGEVGWNTYEEINRVANPTGTPVGNYGWPCIEGPSAQSGYDGANLNLCEPMYGANPSVPNVQPYYSWNHSAKVVAGETCPSGSSSSSGVAFYPDSGPYPAAYRGAMFFSDYSRDCIWAMMPGANGLPNNANIVTFDAGAANPVDLAIGPGNELYYVDLGGTVRRIRYYNGNQPPVAAITADRTSGGSPLTVTFDGSTSADADPADQGLLQYQWDFTNDGTVDATGVTATYTYTSPGTYTARLRVIDTLGVSNDKTVTITAGNDAPTAFIDTPASTLTWAVGNSISFTGHATDPQQGTLPASALSWTIVLHHCSSPGVCHEHPMQTLNGVASGTLTAPDHEYPSYLEFRMTATDAGGLTSTTTVNVEPKTVDLTFASNPAGLQLTVGATSGVAPFTRTVIQGSTNTVSAPTPQSLLNVPHTFTGWSDGGAQTHVVTAPTTDRTYTASYAASCSDSFGYTCSASPRTFVPADGTVLPLTGDDNLTQVTLPFGFKFYGTTYTSAWVDTNGRLSFANQGVSATEHGAIPSAALPNSTIYAYWSDLVVDGSASVRTAVLGTAPNRQFVVEWRNPYQYGFTSRRLNVEAILYENGDVVTNYGGIDNTAEAGASATVGIENATGTVGLQYSNNTSALQNGIGVLFKSPGGGSEPPPVTGTVTGTVTNQGTGTAVSGATVTLSPGGTSTTTAANGTYTFTNVAAGSYTVSASVGSGGACGGGGASAPVTVSSGTSTVNLALTQGADAFGYTCADGTRAFIDADTPLTLTGDDNIVQVTTPFPVKLYGQTYNSAWIDTNGKVSFVNPGAANADHTTLPTTAAPNATAYPFWSDLVVDGSSSVRTGVIGTAPSRAYVVEWRNVFIYGNTSRRLTFEAVFYENGDIAFAYKDLDNAFEQGSNATVGIENAAGTIAYQYSNNQPTLQSGKGVLFHPPA